MQHRLSLSRNCSTSLSKIAKLRRVLARRKVAPAAQNRLIRRVENNPLQIQRFSSSSLSAHHAGVNTIFRSARKKRRVFKGKPSSEARSCPVLNDRQGAEIGRRIKAQTKEQQKIKTVTFVLPLVEQHGPLILLHAASKRKSLIKNYKTRSIEILC